MLPRRRPGPVDKVICASGLTIARLFAPRLLQRRRMGTALAALLNGRARKVTPAAVRALRHALPDSTILVSEDLDQARRHVGELIKQRPEVILSGGGDGAAMRLLNLWREGGGRELPVVGILRLGTGNGWARGVGAPEF